MTFIDANEVRALVDKLVGAAYLDGIHELGAASDETLRARSALEQAIARQQQVAASLPTVTRVHLIGGTAFVIGTPEKGWDEEAPGAHNCDAMGCPTIGPHVLARVPFTDEREKQKT